MPQRTTSSHRLRKLALPKFIGDWVARVLRWPFLRLLWGKIKIATPHSVRLAMTEEGAITRARHAHGYVIARIKARSALIAAIPSARLVIARSGGSHDVAIFSRRHSGHHPSVLSLRGRQRSYPPALSLRGRAAAAAIFNFAHKSTRTFLRSPLAQRATAIFTIILTALTIVIANPLAMDFVQGAYTASSLDADGNTHLGSNTVNDTSYYDQSQDSSAATQQQLGVDPNWSNGVTRESHALSFNGNNSYVGLTANSSNPSSVGDFTLEAWVKLSAYNPSGRQYILDLRGNGSNSYDAPGLIIDGTSPSTTYIEYFAQFSGASYTELHIAYSINLNTWYHLAFVRKGSQFYAFVNGTLLTNAYANGGPNSAAESFTNGGRIGTYSTASSGGNYWFNGDIDEVRVSNTARYTSNFTPSRRFTPDANTVGLWHFDEGSGTTAYDASQYGNNGTLTNSPAWTSGANAIQDGFNASTNPATNGNQTGAGNLALTSTSSSTSKTGYDVKVTGSNALQFNGSTNYTNFSSVPSFVNSSTYTMEVWLKTTSSSRGAVFGVGSSTNTKPFAVFEINSVGGGVVQSGAMEFTARDDAGNTVDIHPNVGINDGNWHHVAAVRNGSNWSLYVDGALVGSQTVTLGTTTVDSFTAGAFYNNSATPTLFYQGTLDEARISNTARYISNFTPSRRFATDGSTVGLWHFDEGSGTTAADVSGKGNTGTLTCTGVGCSNPTWTEGIAADPNQGGTSSANWALPGYQFRKQLNVTNATASTLSPNYGVESTENRGSLMDNSQTLPNGNDWRVEYQPPNQYSSLSFNGTNQYVSAPFTPANGITGSFGENFTVDFWMKAPTDQVNLSDNCNTMASLVGNGKRYFTVNIVNSLVPSNAGTVRFYRYDGTGTPYASSVAKVNDNQWHHIAAVKNGSSLKLYVDGKLSGTATDNTSGASVATNATLSLSPIAAGCNTYYSGQLDEVRLSSGVRYSGNFTPSRLPNSSDSATAALYHLDEGSGTTAIDASGNQNNGTLVNSPAWSTDGAVSTVQQVPRFIPHGHDLSFNGTNQYMEMGDKSSLRPASGSLTVEAWVKPASTQTAYPQIASTSSDNATGYNLYLYNPSGQGVASFIVKQSSEVWASCWAKGTTDLMDGKWHNIVGTYTGSNISIYVDGRLEGSGSCANQSIDYGAGPYYSEIGNKAANASGSNTYFNGQIDEVRVSSVARYKGNFTPSTAPLAKDQYTAGLWHFDDGSGTSAADSSGNGNTGTLMNSPTWITNGGKVDSINETQFKTIAPIAGSGTDSNYYLYYGNLNERGSAQSYSAYGLKFDGSNDTVRVPSSSSLVFTGGTSITISLWTRLSSLPLGVQTFLVKDRDTSGSTGNYGVRYNGQKLEFYYRDSSSWQIWTSTATQFSTTNTWYHVALTYTFGTGSTLTAYINGQGVAGSWSVGSGNTSPLTSNEVLSMGGEYTGGGSPSELMTGSLADVRLYSRALSSSEVSALYSNAPSVSNSGLVGWWKLSDSTPAGTTAADSSGSGNTGTLTNFNFDSTDGWAVNSNLLHAVTEPTVADVLSGPEQESPIFYSWRQSGGSWSVSQPISPTPQQLGSEGVYLSFNPEGLYSRGDYYKVASWAVEPFSTASPARGKLRAFPLRANLIADAAGIDIIDAATNKLWMRIPGGTGNILGTNPPRSVRMENGRLFVASADGLTVIDFTTDSATRYTSAGTATYASTIANRAAASGYGAASGTALSNTSAESVSPAIINGAEYLAVGTDTNLTLLQNSTGTPTAIQYARTASDAYDHVFLTPTGSLYGGDTTAGGLDRWDSVQSDASNKLGTPAPTATYTTATVPALMDNTINAISVTTGTSNTVALADNSGSDVIQENATLANATVKHYVRTGSTGSSNWSSKQFGGAASFNGTSQYISVPSNTVLSPSTITVEAWVYTKSTSAEQMIVNKQVTAGNGYYFEIYNDKLNFAANSNNPQVRGNTAITANVWHHVAATYNGTTVNLFLDGTLDASGALGTGITDSGTPFVIGRYGNQGMLYFNGLIDEVRISNSVRYTTNFTPSRTPFTPDANTVGLWHLDEGAGQTVYDSSGNGNNGTLGATSSVGSDDPLWVYPALDGSSDPATSVAVSPKNDAATRFSSAASQNLTIANNSSVATGNINFAFSGWIYAPDVTTTQIIMAKGSGGNREYLLYLNGGYLSWSVGDGTGNYSINQMAINTNYWYFFVAGLDTSQNKSFLEINNGTTQYSSALTFTPATTTYALALGSYSSNITYYNGNLSNVGFWKNRLLTPADISALYNNGAGRTYASLPSSLKTNLTSWWNLDSTSWKDSVGTNNLTASASAPTITAGGVKSGSVLWVGTNGASTNDGAVTAISLDTDKYITSFSSVTASALPSTDITSLSTTGSGDLALVGTLGGAWNPGLAGIVVDDTAATVATAQAPVRIKSGTVRIKGGTVRVR